MTRDGPGAALKPDADRGRRRWHFAGAVFDERTLELLVRGVDVELERKPLEVLIYLLEHAGEVCTKEELLTGVWPGRILSESVLTKCIGRLREALGDRDQDIIKTAYGFGYRFIAPVRVESGPLPGAGPQPARVAFEAGDHPPGRPLWSLVERLGVGGHGESWRVRHEKTHEQRVFTFALDEASLGTLKREITLFRILNDVLGDRARIVRLLDWNLEQLPYFTEAEYLAAGSLADWVRQRGGLAAIPLAERVGWVAQVATALAVVHSVGVLHKDLKPSTVFVRAVTAEPVEIALGNFGSGGLLDAGHMDRLGITRLGFTRTVAAFPGTAAERLNLAPEISIGGHFTVKSDIYALGVLLYQCVVGDFHRALPREGPLDVDDELLREDIAGCTVADPAARTSDAELLAHRLRSLDERRSRLLAKRAERVSAEDTGRRLDSLRAWRVAAVLGWALLVIALVASGMWHIRERRALGAGSEFVLRNAGELIGLDYASGRLRENLPRYEALLAAGERSSAPDDVALVELQERVARARYWLGDWARAAGDLERLATPARSAGGGVEFDLGQVLTDLSRPAEAAEHLRRALEPAQNGNGSRPSGAEVRTALARALIDLGRFDEAARELDESQGAAQIQAVRALWFLQQDNPQSVEALLTPLLTPMPSSLVDRSGPMWHLLGDAYARQGRMDAAIATLQRAVAVSERADGARHPRTESTRLSLAECLVAEGRDAEARSVLATPPIDVSALPAVHPIAAQWHRVDGFLAQHEGNMAHARKSFGESLAILTALYGPHQWRVVRARQEFERAGS